MPKPKYLEDAEEEGRLSEWRSVTFGIQSIWKLLVAMISGVTCARQRMWHEDNTASNTGQTNDMMTKTVTT